MSRLRLAKISAPSAPPATTAELFYSLADSKLEAIDENGKVTVLGGFAASDYRLIRVFWITASGTYTPTAGTRALYVECVGAGGGGGSANATSANASAAGGGSGGYYAASWITSVAASYSVTIGAGGTGGTAGGGGGVGSDTLFGSLITAKGGTGGIAGTAAGTAPAVTAAAVGQAGSIGDVVFLGGLGGQGVVVSGTLAAAGNGAGSMFGSGNAAQVWVSAGSAGGRSFASYGGGGCGGCNVGTQGTAQGGVGGAAGACRIWEFA